ncbi:hypothetical protein ACFE04_013776 [Oxalis oulophora]
MEQKHILLSAIGVGVGVGIGLASGQTVSKWTGNNISSNPNAITGDKLEQELLKMIVDGSLSQVTFDHFPYYLSEQTRELLTSASYVHLKHADVSKYMRNLSPASRAILLSGPAELYHQMLAKALAHFFEAKLLLLDVTDFSLKMQSKYGSGNKESSMKRSTSESTFEKFSGLLGSFLTQKEEPKGTLRRQGSGMDIASRGNEGPVNSSKLRRNSSAAANINNLDSQFPLANPAPLMRMSSWAFDEKLFIQSLYKVLAYVSKTTPIVLYLRDVDRLLFRSQKLPNFFQKMLRKLSGSVLILGSRITESDNDCENEDLATIFPYNIEIRPPVDENHLVNWKSQLEEDMKKIKAQDNRIHIMEVLSANDLECDDLESVDVADTMELSNYIEEIVVSAISYHLMNNKDPEYRNGKLVISSKSLSHGLNIFHKGKSTGDDSLKLEAKTESSKETKTKPEVGKPESKGEADATSKTGGGTSAAASKAPEIPPDNEFEKRIRPEVIPASDINVTFADIGSLDEIKESLQELVSPTIIFVDEVDSMLGQRTRVGEHEAMRKIKNEFMSHWDGLLTKQGERILVLAATNRPFDLDEAIIRRFERRILVGLPSVENRAKILKTLLAKEKTDANLDFTQLATMTEGYTGSDLKNLCTTAAYRPVRELIKQERLKDMERKKGVAEGQNSEGSGAKEEERVISLRPLNMEDFRDAKNQVAASFASEGASMGELKQWNELYGEGGSRKREQLSYFM